MAKPYAAPRFPFLLIFLLIKNPSQANSETLSFFINNIEISMKASEAALPKNGGNQLPHPNTISPANWWPYLTCEQGLSSGTVTMIDENLEEDPSQYHSSANGKVQGMCITDSEGDSSRMVAMKASFESSGGLNDSLRFFGVHQRGLMEFQIVVIGGTGRYDGANGFAIVKLVGGDSWGIEKKLLFNVYTSRTN